MRKLKLKGKGYLLKVTEILTTGVWIQNQSDEMTDWAKVRISATSIQLVHIHIKMSGVWQWGGKTPAFFADAVEGALLSAWVEVAWRLLDLEAWLAQNSERLGLAVWPRNPLYSSPGRTPGSLGMLSDSCVSAAVALEPGASWACSGSHRLGCQRRAAAAALPSAGSPAAYTWTGSPGAGQLSKLWFLLSLRLWPSMEGGEPGAVAGRH
ncbi:uncharacterized protein LOC133244865 [Bos javanicus]|uniref:uncharacterized protein LOC133244865 n=1 Tax=Bos javanicus TaxID=9906 RepID=UPI002AA8A21E|nr:uncharacterized protein LOC133244865 [Bos javanicus]